MNPMTNVKNIKKLSEQDIKFGGKSSWHDQYKDSAWIFIGGLPYDLTEGDIICVFSQYGEVVHINLVRDKESGKQKGYCFLCYEDQRSTILAVDNLNSIKILGRTLRVDHVENYKAPKEGKKNPIDDETRQLREEGCAPMSNIAQAASYSSRVPPQNQIKTEPTIVGGIRLPPRLPIGPIKVEKTEEQESITRKSKKALKKNKDKNKSKKEKKNKKSKKRKRKYSTSSEESSSSDSESSSSEDDTRRKNKKKHR